MQFLIYTVLQIPMGILADRYGPNFFLIIGAMLTGVGTIVYSVSTHESILFVARLLTGMGDATIWVNLVLVLSQWFTMKEFTRFIGVAAMMGNLGYVFATVPFSKTIDIFGWRGAFFSAGVLIFICGISLFIILVQQLKQPLIKKSNQSLEKVAPLIRRIFSNRQAWMLFMCHFGVVGTYVGFISSWGVHYGMNMYGMTRSDASQLMMLGLIGSLIGGPLASWLASRLGMIRRPYIVVHATLVLAWLTLLIYQGKPPILLLTILFFIIGLAYGANALTFAAVRNSFPVKEAGIVTGFANTGGFLSAILLPSIFGKVLDYFHVTTGSLSAGYVISFIIPVIFASVGFVGVLLLKEKQVESKRVSI